MFHKIQESLGGILSFSDNTGDFTEKEKKFVQTLNFKKFETILRMINDQGEIEKKEYCIYKQNYETLTFEFVSNVTNTDHDEYPTIIDSDNDSFILNALSPQCLSNFILDNQSKNFIFLTLNYTSALHESYHQSIIMFDNEKKLIYAIDPNGTYDFFDKLFSERTCYNIDALLSTYFLELHKFGLNYKYVFISDWNKKNIYLNKKFDNQYVGSGHCVILSLIVINLITHFSVPPNVAFDYLNNLSMEEILYYIKEYSLAIFNILQK